MGRVIEEILETEDMHVALCVEGANKGADIILLKTKGVPAKNPDTPQPSTETDMLTLKQMKAFRKMSTAAAAYFETLTDEKVATAFLDKSVEDQDKDAEAAGHKPTPAAPAAGEGEGGAGGEGDAGGEGGAGGAAAGEGAGAVTEKTADQKRIDELEALVKKMAATVEKNATQTEDQEIEKRVTNEFKSVPSAALILKGIKGLDQPVRDAIEALMKSVAPLKKKAASIVGEEGGNVSTTYKAQHAALVKKIAEDEKITEGQALLKVANMPEHVDLILKVRAEENGQEVFD